MSRTIQRPSLIAAVATFAATLFGAHLSAQETSDMLVDDVAVQFMKAFKAEDADTLSKTVSFPLYFEGRGVLKSNAEFHEQFKAAFAKWDYSDLTWEIKKRSDLKDVVGMMPARERKHLEEVARAGDVAVQIGARTKGNSTGMLLFVRVENGKALIVGIVG